jgi:hypothetical protein
MAFLLTIPAIILAASFIHMAESGSDATLLLLKADATYYTYQDIKNSFKKAGCSYFLLYGNDTTAIKNNLSGEWASYIEENYTGFNISIAEEEINVTYDSSGDIIKIGNINDITRGIAVNITGLSTRIEGMLGPLELADSCATEATQSEQEATMPQAVLFLVTGHNLSFNEGTTQVNETICGGSSVSWIIDPLNSTGDFNITGNIDTYLQINPTNEPSVTVKLSHNGTTIGKESENKLNESTLYVFTITNTAGLTIPYGDMLKLEVSVSGGGSRCIELVYGSSTYNSAVVMPGSFSPAEALDTTPPWFNGLQKLEDYSGYVILSWQPATDDSAPITYKIYRGTSSDFTPATPIATTTSTSYNDSSVGTTAYYYIVRAEDSFGNEDSNLMRLGRVGEGNKTEILYSGGNASGSSDIIDTELDNAESTNIITVDPGDIEIVKFDDPTGSIGEITSCVVYWRDRRTVGNPSRTISVGNSSAYEWGTFTGQATSSYAIYSLDVTSYFTSISSSLHATEIQDVQVKYENGGSGNQDFEWDQIYVIIEY